MDHTNCPHYQKAQLDRQKFDELTAAIRREIEDDMRGLGLKPERFTSLISAAVIQGARAKMLSDEAAITPPTYDEVSREGNVKPVTHPIHIQATAASAAFSAQLKQLGIYASTEKVSTRAQDKTGDESPLDRLTREMMGTQTQEEGSR